MTRRRLMLLLLLLCWLATVAIAFQTPRITTQTASKTRRLYAQQQQDPAIFSSGWSTKPDLIPAIQEAVLAASNNLPHDINIDLCLVFISSLYDGSSSLQPATVTVPAVLAAAQAASGNTIIIDNLIGCSVAGCISSSIATNNNNNINCQTQELEGIPCVSVTFMKLPETSVRVFHVAGADLPEGTHSTTAKEWKRCVGLSGIQEETNNQDDDPPVFLVLPSPAFSTDLDDFLESLENVFPESQIIGGIASTVSSLSRAKLYCYSSNRQDVCFADGIVGVAISGDIKVHAMTALGAKPVGGIYQIVKGQDTQISVITLDETATNALKDDDADELEELDEQQQQEEIPKDKRAAMAQFYAKAQIPKPILAEANFLMRTLSDDDQAFMRRQLLVGLENGGAFGRTASELQRLAAGHGHRFTVHQVASAGMKDGSVTLPLGSVKITNGTRLRFFVREPDFARLEVEALWTGYKKKTLNAEFQDTGSSFAPGMCLVIPTLDRGSKFFQKTGYESSTAARVLPTVASINGFFANAIVGRLDGSENAKTGIQGSASGYFLIGSKSGRPVYSKSAAAAQQRSDDEDDDDDDDSNKEESTLPRRTGSVAELDRAAPRGEDGELLLKRREVHSGRALTVSTVEWSVAEKTAKPSSALEGFMWDKETEVDRFRERVPLQNLVSQCGLSVSDPKSPKPRDWIGPLKNTNRFVIVPECKRMDPASGSLRKRYNVQDLVREFTISGAPAISVNCDSILFGGSMDHIEIARKASSQAAVETMNSDGVIVPPILASDLILYPYQLYKLRLAGADAVTLVAGALAAKDLLYLTKIASSVQLQTVVMVTSSVQIERLINLPVLEGVILSNRILEDFSFDETGDQVLELLKSDAMAKLKSVHPDVLVLTEGRIGIIERDGSAENYIKQLRDAGAHGAILGSGLAKTDAMNLQDLQSAI